MSIHFGTDGWRAVISDEFTFANVRKVAQGIADFVLENASHSPPLVVVGYDTRFLSDHYAREVARVLAANGISVYLTQRDTPTPIVSFAIRHVGASYGVMITASHNPPRYNGIKLKGAFGGPALPADTRRVEALIRSAEEEGRSPRTMPFEEAERMGRITRFDPFPLYRTHVWQLVRQEPIALAAPRVIVDPMYGAGRGYFKQLLGSAGARVEEIHGVMNPGFNGLHPEPIPRNLGPLMDAVRERGPVFGLATDGDADRIAAVDEKGRFVDPHHILALTLRFLVHQRGWSGAVVKTVSTTRMLDRLAERYGLPLYETPVGFNYIVEHILERDVLIGGEESGGMTILHHIPEGDGLLMGLLLTEILATTGGTLVDLVEDLHREVGPFVYDRLDYRVTAFSKPELVRRLSENPPATLAGLPVRAISTRDGVKYMMDSAWLLIRPSGTEPVLRIYAEAPDRGTVHALLEEGKRLFREVYGAGE